MALGADGSELAAVMRRSPGAAADFAARHNVALSFESAEELVNCPEVNAVYIASPPGAHLEHAKLAAAAGKPTYIEKPLGRNADEGESMRDLPPPARPPCTVRRH